MAMLEASGSSLNLADAKFNIKETTYPGVVEVELTVNCMIDTPLLVKLLESE